MEESFELPVNYKGQELLFPAKLIQFGYSYRIEVEVNGKVVSFERDEEGNWRALEYADQTKSDPSIKPELFEAIAWSLSNIGK